jgi:ferric-dicitrate binding protein FerR (iron transport regulator)
LSGEAFFDVRHDSNHPFVVQLNDLKITDLGTRFNVSAYLSDPRVETVLTEGKVTINRNNSGIFDKATQLIPGQMASYNKQTLQTEIHEVDVADYTLWKDGIIKFNSMELSRIVKKLERFYNIHFLFNDPQLETLRISGKLELNENTHEVVERIARTASVSITKNVDGAFEIAK